MTELRTPLAIAAISTLLVGCRSNNGENETAKKPRATVAVAIAATGSIDATVTSTGSFEMLLDERIKSTISGKVRDVFVLEGDVVRKGQKLVSILSQESNAAIDGAAQMVARANTDSARDHAERALRLAEHSAAFATINAPFSGAITHRYVTEGELVAQGADLVEIVDPRSKYFVANIPLSDISSVKPGQTAVVILSNLEASPIQGIVRAINPSTDPSSQSVQVRISLTDIPAMVTRGVFGHVRITVGRHQGVVVIPQAAMYHDDELGRYQVWRIQGDTVALITPVMVGLMDSSRAEVLSGISTGDAVATAGGYGLPDSTAVTVEPH